MKPELSVQPRRNTISTASSIACFLFVLSTHVGIGLFLIHGAASLPDEVQPSPEDITLDVALEPNPLPQVAQPPEEQPKPGVAPPPAPEPAPEPPFPVEPPPPQTPVLQTVAPPIPVDPATEPALPKLPQPLPSLPSRSPIPKRPVLRQRPMSTQEKTTEQTSSPSLPTTTSTSATSVPKAFSPKAVPTWQGELIARLQHAKRYPDAARVRAEQGVATVRFTLNRQGHVLSVNLIRSSGSQSLDEEAVALIHRVDPLPPLPVEMSDDTVTLTAPVSFTMR